MIKLCQDFCLDHQPFGKELILFIGRLGYLESYLTSQDRIFRPVDDPHAATSEHIDQLVALIHDLFQVERSGKLVDLFIGELHAFEKEPRINLMSSLNST